MAPSLARPYVSQIVESRSIVKGLGAGSRSGRPGPGEELPADGVELADVAPAEAAQERPEGRGSLDGEAEDPRRAARSERGRVDDPTPLAVHASLASYVGRPLGHLRASDRKYHWRAASLADVQAVVRFLDRHPLLSPRGAAQLEVVREAGFILAAARERRGAAVPLDPAELRRLGELRAAIPARERVSASLPLPAAARDADDRRLGSYFAGFVAAEGCFGVQRDGTRRVTPWFALTQRVDNLALLEHLRDRLGIGRIQRIPVTVGSPAVQLVVEREDDIDRLIGQLRVHPLPATSPKAAQLDAWAEVIAVRRAVIATQRRGSLGRSEAVGALVDELHAAKRYQGRRPLCACPRQERADAPS